jgi:branched-chain amino acid transport system permease protein
VTVLSLLDTLLQGLLLGGLYALFALGQSLLFGVMRLTNTAHGDLIILAAFAAFSLTALTGSPWIALVILLPISFAAGYALQRLVFNGTLGKDPLPSLVVTFGLSIVIQNGLQEIYTADPRSIESGGLNTASISLAGGLSAGLLPLLTFGVALALTAALQWLFVHTGLGRSFRAVSDDREAAELMGLDYRHVYAKATAIAFALVAIAGTLQGLKTTVSASDGPSLLLYAFESVIIGGLGSFYGTFAGGLILGVTQDLGYRVDPGWGIWTGHLVFLVTLLLRPSGLFPRTR